MRAGRPFLEFKAPCSKVWFAAGLLLLAACSSKTDDDQPQAGTGAAGVSGLTAGSGGVAGMAGTGAMAGGIGVAGTGAGGGSDFPAVSDFAADGPFATMMETVTAPACTIFRPSTLGGDGLKHPIIVWGNGTFANPGIYMAVLTHWASHGFIVAAAQTSNAGMGTEMIACLDYVIAQDAVAGSAYEGKVDAAHVGTSGHSQGGGGSIMAGRDARVTATAPLQPYVTGLGHMASSQSMQAGPMFLMSGAQDTIATRAAQQQQIFDNANVPVFWGTLAGADHLGAATGDITGYRGPATAWFRLQLMADESARELFHGADCGLCTDAMWEVERKDIQ